MPICTVNGLNIYEAEIYIPRVGVWSANFNLDSDSALIGKATIAFGSQTFNGTFERSGPSDNGRVRVRVIGGANGLSNLLKPKSYRFAPIKIPLGDAATDLAETISRESDPSILTFQLRAWSRMSISGGSAIRSLLGTLPQVASWRMLLDGTIWVGYEQWKVSSLTDFRLLATEPEKGRILISSIDPVVLPGTTFAYQLPRTQVTSSQKVSYVCHRILHDKMTTLLYFE
jgi:hypothetical protein